MAIGSSFSSLASLECGVPQGSVLGPKLFTMYMRPFNRLLSDHNVMFHFYADDSQVYISFKPGPQELPSVDALEACISDVRAWMQNSLLKLNDEKTEVMFLGSKHNLKTLSTTTLTVGEHTITPSHQARNLGVIFDEGLVMDKQITSVSRGCYMQLQRIGPIRSLLTIDALKSLIHATITSRLDYANSLLYGVNKFQLNRLQKIQTCCALLITRSSGRCQITPIL